MTALPDTAITIRLAADDDSVALRRRGKRTDRATPRGRPVVGPTACP